MFNIIVGAGAVGGGAGAASRYGSGFDQKMRLLAAPAPQHCIIVYCISVTDRISIQPRPWILLRGRDPSQLAIRKTYKSCWKCLVYA
jgi:hypothetical protein